MAKASQLAYLFRRSVSDRNHQRSQSGRLRRRIDPRRESIASLTDDSIINMMEKEIERLEGQHIASKLDNMPCRVCKFDDDSVGLIYPETMRIEVLRPGKRKTWAVEQFGE